MNNPSQEFEEDGESFESSPEDGIEYINVYKHLSEANPLLEKVEFEHYHVNVVLPVHFTRLPKQLREATQYESQTNMSKLQDSMFYHQKLKQRMDSLLSRAPQPNTLSILPSRGTLFDRYSTHLPIYRKFLNFDRRYFATAVIDLKGLNRKSKLMQHITQPCTSRQNSIQFESNFQSGNLYQVYQVGENHYQMVLQNDVNTRGNNQWFFWRVRNVPKGRTLKFSVVNNIKNDSLFNYGMKPTVFSKVRYEKRKIGWVRQGQKISYQQNNIKRQTKDTNFYTLSFQYKFTYQSDTVYFSHSYPYTFSDLSQYLSNLFTRKQVGRIASIKTLSRTIGKNKLDQLTISKKTSKKTVWILARQHPGEVTSSFMVQGMIDYLLSESRAAEYLRDNIVFKIIPMVNPDGVVHGNARCELVGVDPNRRWKQPSRLVHPGIYVIRKQMEKGGNVDMVLDLHSHSRKLGTFFYGNSLLHKPEASRVFPLFVCRNDQRFSFENSRFGGGYATTARSALFKLLKIPKVYTVQSSFYAYQSPNKDIIQYLPDDYRTMGRSLLQNYASLLSQQNPQICTPIYRKTGDLRKVLSQLQLPSVIELGEKESAGSDSDPSEDEFDQEELARILPKKIELKKKKRRVSKQKVVEKGEKEKGRESIMEREPVVVSCASQIRKKVSDFIRRSVQTNPLKQDRSNIPPPHKYSSIQSRPVIPRRPLPTSTHSTQTDPIQPLLSTPNNRSQPHNLCIIGTKVQQKQVWLGQSQIGTQTLTTRQRPPSKDLIIGRGSLRMPKFFNVVPMKENNFLVRDYSLRRS